MNEAIIQRHNSLVRPEDDVYCLGDEILNDMEGGINCINRLNGRLHLIRGNHSTDGKLLRIQQSCPNVVDIGKWADVLKYHKYTFYLSHFPALTANFDGDKPLNRRLINLCGHIHTKDKFRDMDKGLCYHVDVDAHDCKPVLLDNIIEDLEKWMAAH